MKRTSALKSVIQEETSGGGIAAISGINRKNNQFFINDMEQLSKSITAKDIPDTWGKSLSCYLQRIFLFGGLPLTFCLAEEMLVTFICFYHH